jgi:hypothetical protein
MASGDFVCDDCGCLDNIHSTKQTGHGFHCSECKDGYWHGDFSKEQYDEDVHHDVLNRSGYHPSFS